MRPLTAPHALMEPARPDSVIGLSLAGPMAPENGTMDRTLAGVASASMLAEKGPKDCPIGALMIAAAAIG